MAVEKKKISAKNSIIIENLHLYHLYHKYMHFITEMKRNIIHVWVYSSVSCLICLETVLNVKI